MSRTARGPRRWARVALVRLQRHEPPHRLVRRLGAVAVRRLGSHLAALPGVEAVFARHLTVQQQRLADAQNSLKEQVAQLLSEVKSEN